MRKKPKYRFATFQRGGRIYVRFSTEGGRVFATRSTGCTTKAEASGVIARMLQELDLDALESSHKQKTEADYLENERRRRQSFADYVLWFWGPASDYLDDRKKAGAPLSGKYISNNLAYVRRHVATYPPFQKTALADIAFHHVDSFARSLAKLGKSRHIIDIVVNAIRAPVSWGSARGLCSPIAFGGLTLPASIDRERGILSDAEIKKILELPTAKTWRAKDTSIVHIDARPRPRLSGGAKNTGAEPIDMRMKAFLLFGLFAGLRRGEERGLKWGSVDLETNELIIRDNFQEIDGLKAPKARSVGRVPIAPELEPILWELREAAKMLGLFSPADFVLMNPTDPSKPVALSTLRRGWIRILTMIGIDDAERERRHLVPHGTRHRFATKLLDAGFTPSEAGKLTRQKTQAVVEKYGGHLSDETRARAHRALRIQPEAEAQK